MVGKQAEERGIVMKVIKVEKCKTCPLVFKQYTAPHHSFYGPTREYYCKHSSAEGMDIDNPEIIHPDCLLEDYKKGE